MAEASTTDTMKSEPLRAEPGEGGRWQSPVTPCVVPRIRSFVLLRGIPSREYTSLYILLVVSFSFIELKYTDVPS